MNIKKRGILVIVLTLLVLFSYLASADISGCYLYSQSEDLYCVPEILDTEAQVDCDTYPNCDMATHFKPNSDCSEYGVCEEVMCNVDCEFHSLGVCEEMGGIAIADSGVEYSTWCDVGCCKLTEGQTVEFCSYNIKKFDCNEKAKVLNVFDEIYFNNDLFMNAETCNKNICDIVQEKGTLTFTVIDELGEPVTQAKVVLKGTGQEGFTDTSLGKLTFPPMTPGTYSIEVSKTKYSTESLVLTLSSNQTLEETVMLTKLTGIATVEGAVTDIGGPIEGATVAWTGPVSGNTKTTSTGSYSVENLPIGDYSFTASKIGYIAKSTPKKIDLDATYPINFQLEEKTMQGISGTVYVDTDPDKVLDITKDSFKIDAKIYLNGVYKGNSQYPDGTYSINVEVDGKQTFILSATFLDYESEPIEIDFEPGDSIVQPILLTKYVGVCTEPDSEKIAENFTGQPVQGEKAIKLQWTKPCPEVWGYTINVMEGEEVIRTITASPAQTFIVDYHPSLEWGQDYTYQITADYDKNRHAINEETITINVGDKECADRYDQNLAKWDSFCLIGNIELRKLVWTCNPQNQLVENDNCNPLDDEATQKDYYCAPLTSSEAACRDQGSCGIQGQSSDPFGLYYSRSSCYGTTTPEDGAATYCYFDYTETVVDECNQCKEIDSCYSYRSKDACEIDNCLFGGEKCQWVNGADNTQVINYNAINLPVLVTEETGAGYCVEKDYTGTDDDKIGDSYCSLCSPKTDLFPEEGNLFENFFCTADVCSGLGRCYSQFELDECNGCGESPTDEKNCYSYTTEHECSGGQDTDMDAFNQITLSEDRCGWERCFWKDSSVQHSEEGCVKDGNADKTDDCSEFISGEITLCKADNSAPRTKLVPEGINIVSLASPNITFYGDDTYHKYSFQSNQLGLIGLCLTESNANAQSLCAKGDFEKFNYPGNDQDELVSINLLETKFLQDEIINGETYRLLYYSEDRYYNQESLQETYIFVDNVAPQFDINTSIETSGDVSKLSVWLKNTNEIMGCSFTLKSILPAGDDKVINVPREEENKAAEFEGLEIIKGNLTVMCIDDQGNVNTKSKELTFDLETRIDVIYPAMDSTVSETKIKFKAETAAGATCGLYLTSTNEKVADFVSDEKGKAHESTEITEFSEGVYASVYKIVCQEILDPSKAYEDYFHFTVDFTPPTTQIKLTEGTREVLPGGNYWEEFFIESVSVDFDCSADGFECDKTYYCLGFGCDFIGDEKFQEFTEPVELTESTNICYYSTDLGESPVYQPLCGEVKIEGYGIVLDKPKAHYYENEQWGISNEIAFEFRFFTKVPTTECKIDFYPQFDYYVTPQHQVRYNSEGYYTFETFPEDVFKVYEEDCVGDQCVKEIYVKCTNLDGLLGPEQKIYLEYDNSNPEIISAYADPDKVYEGVSTELFVETDDKTLCKYDDISDGGEKEYADMAYFFPGSTAEERILNLLHTDTFYIDFSGPSKNYVLSAQCANGAGDLSETENIEFLVDYSDQGYILPESLSPSGIINYQEVILYAETSRKAVCSYRLTGNESSYVPFSEGINTNAHSSPVTLSGEGEYSVQLKCVMADYIDHEKINFILDQTPPSITSIADGNFSCGSDEVGLMVYTDELGDIAQYIYEVYDAGEMVNNPYKENGTSSSSSAVNKTKPTTGQLIYSGNYSGALPVKIPTEDLTPGRKYKFKVRAVDSVGNIGQFVESDGIVITKSNYSICQMDQDAPTITFLQNKSSCSAVKVELVCNDIVGCKEILYGRHGISTKCNATTPYSGSKLSFDDSEWLCYYVEDYTGENHSDVKKIEFSDSDGDGVADHCDDCLATPSGKSVSAIGCSDEQIPDSKTSEDSDGDSLPDNWEKMFDALDCEFNYASPDSNDDGVSDNLEDYDDDGYSNYEEYTMGYNPCLADVYEEDEEEVIVEKYDPGAITPQGDGASIVPLIFLLMGILMVLGGIGYLIYYYKYSPAALTSVSKPQQQRRMPGAPRMPTQRIQSGTPQRTTGAPSLIDNWKEKIVQLRRGREKKLKSRARANVFGEFGKKSQEIPKVNEILSKKAPHLSKLKELSQHYVEHKEEIKPGLRPGEKSIFNRLENISNKTKDKKISDVVSKDEAKDIFSKLKTLSKKRKEK
jgi:hypothetical protein